MRTIDELFLIAAPTFRTRAYVQRMTGEGIVPARAFLMPGKEPEWDGAHSLDLDLREDGRCFRFKPGTAAVDTLEAHGVPCETLSDCNINDTRVVDVLSSADADVFLYSGVGANLLEPATLNCGKRFLHAHGGFVPHFRGSTAFYYSLISEGNIGASVIWLQKGIDTGAILARRKYKPIEGEEIDRVLDPAVRADLLVEVLHQRLETGAFPAGDYDNEDSETFFIIHPVLKHIALKRCRLI